MPKFIKTNTITEVNRHGIESDRQVLFTDDEVVSRAILNPSLIVEVTESHAAQVIRVQGKYQELTDDVLNKLDDEREVREEVKAAKAAKSKAKTKNTPVKEEEKVQVADETKGGTLKFGSAE